MKQDLSEILGVSSSASVDEIHAAFRKMARQHHPDLGGDLKKFQELNTAYEELLRQKMAERSGSRKVSEEAPTSGGERTAADSIDKTSESSSFSSGFSDSAKYLLTGKLPLQDQTTYFILVNALDIFLTWVHLQSGNYEANPIANFFFRNWNISGMIAFKLTIVAAVCVISQIIALRSLRKAEWLLYFGIAFTACVVVYSVWLLAS